MKIKMKGSPLPQDRREFCEPLAQQVKDLILSWVEGGQITLREAADMTDGLQFAFSTTIKLFEANGLEDELDRLKEPNRDTPSEA